MEATSSTDTAPMPAEPKREEPTIEEPKVEEPEVKSEEPKPEPEPYIKEDPDAPEFVSAHSTGRRPRVKPEPEEPAQVTIDLSLPEAGDDMFEDVDGDEYVDLTYEGIAHVNGVRHFVCEGQLSWSRLTACKVYSLQASRFARSQSLLLSSDRCSTSTVSTFLQ